jgi:FkbM family methyltransferase
MLKRFAVKTLDLLLGKAYGRKQSQSFFGLLHSISIKGMNLRYDPSGNNGETWVIEFIARYFKSRNVQPVLFDVGANKGTYSLELGRTFPDAALHSFEPSRNTFKLLEANILPAFPAARLHNFGLSDQHAFLKLYCSAADHTTNSLYRDENFRSDSRNAVEEIEVRRLDEFCRENKVRHIHFMKVDVEGNEINVFKGALPLIEAQAIDFIQFEFGPRNVDSRTFLKDFYQLLEPHYRIYRVLKNGLHPLTPYHQDYEAFFAGNYLAVSSTITPFA